MSSPTAPRTPDTDKEVDCVNDTMSQSKLTLDVSTTGLQLARAEYDRKLEGLVAAEGSTMKQESAVNDEDLAITFLQTQMDYAIGRQTKLKAAWEAANTAVILCNTDPDSCTVAGKSIKIAASNSALQQDLDNGSDIANYQSDIKEKKANLIILQSALSTMTAGASVGIANALTDVNEAEIEYIDKREIQKRAKSDYDELHWECKFNAFHENQETLTELRQDLARWGVLIEVQQTVADDNEDRLAGKDPDSDPDAPHEIQIEKGQNDCRYKSIQACQGRQLLSLSTETRQTCRETMNAVCFEKTYETYWILDFLSFLFLPWAIIGCIWEENFEYSLCMGSYVYIMVLSNTLQMGLEY